MIRGPELQQNARCRGACEGHRTALRPELLVQAGGSDEDVGVGEGAGSACDINLNSSEDIALIVAFNKQSGMSMVKPL